MNFDFERTDRDSLAQLDATEAAWIGLGDSSLEAMHCDSGCDGEAAATGGDTVIVERASELRFLYRDRSSLAPLLSSLAPLLEFSLYSDGMKSLIN